MPPLEVADIAKVVLKRRRPAIELERCIDRELRHTVAIKSPTTNHGVRHVRIGQEIPLTATSWHQLIHVLGGPLDPQNFHAISKRAGFKSQTLGRVAGAFDLPTTRLKRRENL